MAEQVHIPKSWEDRVLRILFSLEWQFLVHGINGTVVRCPSCKVTVLEVEITPDRHQAGCDLAIILAPERERWQGVRRG